MATTASRQEFAVIELQSTLVANRRSKPVKDQLSAHVTSLQDLKKQLMARIKDAGDFTANKKTYSPLVGLMNKYKECKAEAKPHIKASTTKKGPQPEGVQAD